MAFDSKQLYNGLLLASSDMESYNVLDVLWKTGAYSCRETAEKSFMKFVRGHTEIMKDLHPSMKESKEGIYTRHKKNANKKREDEYYMSRHNLVRLLTHLGDEIGAPLRECLHTCSTKEGLDAAIMAHTSFEERREKLTKEKATSLWRQIYKDSRYFFNKQRINIELEDIIELCGYMEPSKSEDGRLFPMMPQAKEFNKDNLMYVSKEERDRLLKVWKYKKALTYLPQHKPSLFNIYIQGITKL